MAHLTTPSIVRQLSALFEGGSAAALSDRQLIERFSHRRDEADAEAAFAALVARHGPMVLGVCRQLLDDRHLTEDAFQATFLVLARKAHSLRDPDRLATWLYGVALRTARKARARIARQRQHEQGDTMADAALEPTSPPAEQALLDREQAEVLHTAIDHLPDTFRSPIVLCYFEGLTLDEAAHRLRCPAGTLRSRLARAREKLRRALTRRGFSLSVAAPDFLPAPASVSTNLCDLTARAALRFAARPAMTSTATTLAHEVLRAMTIHKLTTALATLLFLAALAVGGGCLARALARGDEPRKAPAVVQAPVAAVEKPAPGRMFVVGRVLDPGGKPVPGTTVMAYAAIKQPGRGDYFDRRDPAAIGQARTDDSGRFRLDATRTTSAHHHRTGAVALAPGYGAGWVELDPDADRPAAEITLNPEQVIEGRLFDVNGLPVRDVEVTVQAMIRVIPGRPDLTLPERFEGPSFSRYHHNELPAWPRPAFSDAEGRFTIRGAARGFHVELAVDDPRFARLKVPVETDAASRSKSVTAALEPARIIAGRVTDDETDQSIPHARIVVLSYKNGAGYVNQFEADNQGRFRMNPLSADRFHVSVHSPDSGRPYLGSSVEFDWPKGKVEHRVNLSLRRGVLIRGKVVEEGTGRPVAARISFGTKRADEPNGVSTGRGESAPDGSFQVAVLPVPGCLIVLAPSDHYEYRSIDGQVVREGRPGGRRYYAHAIVPIEPKPDREPTEVAVPLRRGVTVAGRVVGPDGRPIASAEMIGRMFLAPGPGAWLSRAPHSTGRVRDGRFEVHGLDPDIEVPVHFFEPKAGLGATVNLSGKSGSGGPVVVRLEPCGTARARLVNPAGKPVAGTRFRRIGLVVTPGAHPSGPGDRPAEILAESTALLVVNPTHYGDGPVSDAEGRITFPALIPGATYHVSDGPRAGPVRHKEFTVKPGETVDLGDIRFERPQVPVR